MSKFIRNFKLIYTVPPTTTDKDAEVITIESPLTVDFDITRNTFSSANNATFRLYNLAPTTRDKIFQDKYNIFRFCFVDFYAGYGDQLSLLFTGKVMQAYSERQGTEMVTEIQALDAFGIFDYSTHTFPKGTGTHDLIKTLANDMEHIKLGAVGVPDERITSHLSIDSVSFDAISKVTGGLCFVDLGKLNILKNNQVLQDAEIYKIDSDTGLLGTPKRRDAQVEIDMIFEPRITVGQLVEVESSTARIFDGQFKVIGIHHAGTISGAIAGEARTTLNLFIGPLIPNSNQIYTFDSPKEPLSEVKDFKVAPVTKQVLSSLKEIRQYLIDYGKPPDKWATNHISWKSLLNPYGLQEETPSLTVLSNLYQVATLLEAFYKRFFNGKNLRIQGGWRSRSYNMYLKSKNPKVATNSRHITGQAIDFTIGGVSNSTVWSYAFKYWAGWGHYDSQHIHLDTSKGAKRIGGDY